MDVNSEKEFMCPKCGSNDAKKVMKISGIALWIFGIYLVISDIFYVEQNPFNFPNISVFVVAIILDLIGKSHKIPEGKWEMKCERCGERFLIDEPNKKH